MQHRTATEGGRCANFRTPHLRRRNVLKNVFASSGNIFSLCTLVFQRGTRALRTFYGVGIYHNVCINYFMGSVLSRSVAGIVLNGL